MLRLISHHTPPQNQSRTARALLYTLVGACQQLQCVCLSQTHLAQDHHVHRCFLIRHPLPIGSHLSCFGDTYATQTRVLHLTNHSVYLANCFHQLQSDSRNQLGSYVLLLHSIPMHILLLCVFSDCFFQGVVMHNGRHWFAFFGLQAFGARLPFVVLKRIITHLMLTHQEQCP